ALIESINMLLVPPLGVISIAGCGGDLVINIILTSLGYLPGVLHALYVYASK
ncbi:hypothetical protein BDZ91DRAFT_656409, partial [Kalaharituber pfeilii]